MIHRCSYTHTCSYSWWKTGVHQLRLVVYPYYLQGFRNIPGGCLGFFPSTVAFCRFSRTELHSHFQTSCVDDFLMNLEAGYYITIWILAKPSECFWKTLLYMAYDAGNHFLDSRWFRASTAPLSLHSLQRREILSSMNCSVFPCEKGAKNTVPNKTTKTPPMLCCLRGVESPTWSCIKSHSPWLHSPVLSHQQVMTSARCLLQHLWKEESKCQHYSPNMEPENDGFQKEISFSKSPFFRFHVSLGGKSNPFKKSELKDEGIASRCITTFSVDLTVAVVDLVLFKSLPKT